MQARSVDLLIERLQTMPHTQPLLIEGVNGKSTLASLLSTYIARDAVGAGLLPYTLDAAELAANQAYAEAWAGRLMGCQRGALL